MNVWIAKHGLDFFINILVFCEFVGEYRYERSLCGRYFCRDDGAGGWIC